MRTLCLGGSFNPIHHGHLICARAVAEKAGFEQILLIPSAQPPHKPNHPDLAAPEHRLRMCQLAAEPSDGLFVVDDLELRRSGPSYTLDTARQLKRRGIDPVHWLIGADMLNFLPNWHRPLELLREVDFLIMSRPGFELEWSKLPGEYQFLKDNVIEAPRIDISSSDIRARVRAGRSIDFLTPPSVVAYIRVNQLYA